MTVDTEALREQASEAAMYEPSGDYAGSDGLLAGMRSRVTCQCRT
jgi:hypothetical protein